MGDHLKALRPYTMAGTPEPNLHEKHYLPIIMTFLQSLTKEEWTTFREGLREPMTEQQLKEVVLNIVKVVTATALKLILPEMKKVMMRMVDPVDCEMETPPVTGQHDTARSQTSLLSVQTYSQDRRSPLTSMFGITEGSILLNIQESLVQALSDLGSAYSSVDSDRLVPDMVKEVLGQVNVVLADNIPMANRHQPTAMLIVRPDFSCQEIAKKMISAVSSQLTASITGLSSSSSRDEADLDCAVSPTMRKVITSITEIIHSCIDEEDQCMQKLALAISEKVKALLCMSRLGERLRVQTSSHDVKVLCTSINGLQFSTTTMKAVSAVLKKRLSSDAGFDLAQLQPLKDENAQGTKTPPQAIDLISSELIGTFAKGMEREVVSFQGALAKHSLPVQPVSVTDREALNRNVMSSVNNVYAAMLGKVRSILLQIHSDPRQSFLALPSIRAREYESVSVNSSHVHRPAQRSQSESQVATLYPHDPQPSRAVSLTLLSQAQLDTCTTNLLRETFTSSRFELSKDGSGLPGSRSVSSSSSLTGSRYSDVLEYIVDDFSSSVHSLTSHGGFAIEDVPHVLLSAQLGSLNGYQNTKSHQSVQTLALENLSESQVATLYPHDPQLSRAVSLTLLSQAQLDTCTTNLLRETSTSSRFELSKDGSGLPGSRSVSSSSSLTGSRFSDVLEYIVDDFSSSVHSLTSHGGFDIKDVPHVLLSAQLGSLNGYQNTKSHQSVQTLSLENLSSGQFQKEDRKSMDATLPQDSILPSGCSAQELGSKVSGCSANSMSIERHRSNLIPSPRKWSCQSFDLTASQALRSVRSLPNLRSFSHVWESFRTYSSLTFSKENLPSTSSRQEEFAQWISPDLKSSTKEVIREILHSYRKETTQKEELVKEQVLDPIPVTYLFVEAVISGLEDLSSSSSPTSTKQMLSESATSTPKTLSKEFLAKATELTGEVLQKSMLVTSDVNEITADFPGRIGLKESLENLKDPETTAYSMMRTVVNEVQILTQFSVGRAASIEHVMEKKSRDSLGFEAVLAGSPLALDVKTSSAAQNVFQSWRKQLANFFANQEHSAVKNEDTEGRAKGAIKSILLAVKAAVSKSSSTDESLQVGEIIAKVMEGVATVTTESGQNIQSTNLKQQHVSSECSSTALTGWLSEKLPSLPGTPVPAEVTDSIYRCGNADAFARMGHIASTESEAIDSLVGTLVDTIDSERLSQAIAPNDLAAFAERLDLDTSEVTFHTFSRDLADKIHSVLAMSHLSAGKSWSDSVLATNEYRNAEMIDFATYKIISMFAEKSVKHLLWSCLFADQPVDYGQNFSAHDAVVPDSSSCVVTPIVIDQIYGQIWKSPSESVNNMMQQFTTTMVNQVMKSVSTFSSGRGHFEAVKSQGGDPPRVADRDDDNSTMICSPTVISPTPSTSIDVWSGSDQESSPAGIITSDKMISRNPGVPTVSPCAVRHCLQTVFLKVQKVFCEGVAGSQVIEPWGTRFTSVVECVLGLLSTARGLNLEDRMDLPKELHISVIEVVYKEILRRIQATEDVDVQALHSGDQMLAGAFAISIVKAVQREDLAQFLYCPSTHGSLDLVSIASRNVDKHPDALSRPGTLGLKESTRLVYLLTVRLLANMPSAEVPVSTPTWISPQELVRKLCEECLDAPETASTSAKPKIDVVFENMFSDLSQELGAEKLLGIAAVPQDYSIENALVASLSKQILKCSNENISANLTVKPTVSVVAEVGVKTKQKCSLMEMISNMTRKKRVPAKQTTCRSQVDRTPSSGTHEISPLEPVSHGQTTHQRSFLQRLGYMFKKLKKGKISSRLSGSSRKSDASQVTMCCFPVLNSVFRKWGARK